MLTVEEHSRDSAGMIYVYPVVSRRARGVSLGINLNPNNACNWQCVYCQVPALTRGGPPPIDLRLLRQELDSFLKADALEHFMRTQVPAEARVLQDVAFSGNGEPTMAAEFPDAIRVAVDALRAHGWLGRLKMRLITNGSQVEKPKVKQGLRLLAEANGEVWFKFDAATAAGMSAANQVRIAPLAHLRRLAACAALCPTWVQSCFFLFDGRPPAEEEVAAYVAAMKSVAGKIAGIHLYGLARPSMQPAAPRLGRLPAQWFDTLAMRLREQGLTVAVSP